MNISMRVITKIEIVYLLSTSFEWSSPLYRIDSLTNDIDYLDFELYSIEDSIEDHANTRIEYNMVDMKVIEA